MRYIYQGYLSKQTVEHIESMARDYDHVVQIEKLPDNWQAWKESNFKDYTENAEDCMGQPYRRKTKMYGFVQGRNVGEGPFFLFLKSYDEKELFVRTFPELVQREKPFDTIVDLPDKPKSKKIGCYLGLHSYHADEPDITDRIRQDRNDWVEAGRYLGVSIEDLIQVGIKTCVNCDHETFMMREGRWPSQRFGDWKKCSYEEYQKVLGMPIVPKQDSGK